VRYANGVLMTTTAALARFVATLAFEELPAELVDRVKRQFLDVVGVALAGSTEPAVEAVRLLVGEGGPAAIWGTARSAASADAALVNATAAHALDFDDMWLPGAHPSAPIVPAALAVAEERGASGQQLIAALVAGYEVMGRLHGAVSGRFGWHPTGVFGTFGATAAAGRLLELDEEQTAMAFGIASSMAGGIDGHSGTMTKPLHAGLAAQSGVRAAQLAAHGFTASDHVFDGRRSFFESFFPSVAIQSWRLTADLGQTFHLLTPGIGIKMYPAGYYLHQTFEAALHIVTEHGLHADDIAAIRIGTTGSRFDRPWPRSSLDAKFSLQYMATAAVLFRRLTVDLFGDAIVASEEVQQVLDRIETYVDPTIPANPDIAHNPVTITVTDGREFRAAVDRPRSHWRYPLPREAWTEKFRANVRGRVAYPESIIDATVVLEELDDVRQVTKLFAAAAG
jgi:2-methylcitrate dehydratase PrpD